MKTAFTQYLTLSSVLMLALVIHAPTVFATDKDDSRHRKHQLTKAAIETASQIATAVSKAANLFKIHGRPSVGAQTVDTQLRRLKNTKTKKAKNHIIEEEPNKELSVQFNLMQQYKEELDQCEAEKNSPKNLFVQMANHCTLERLVSTSNVTLYNLITSDMHDETWVFTDRPFRHEETMSSKDFLNNFNETFRTSLPNAAVTFVSEKENIFEGPLVSVFLDGVYSESAVFLNNTSTTTYTYVLEQSSDQREVIALDSFFSNDEDVMIYEDCSIFIDSASGSSDISSTCLTSDQTNLLSFGVGTSSAALGVAAGLAEGAILSSGPVGLLIVLTAEAVMYGINSYGCSLDLEQIKEEILGAIYYSDYQTLMNEIKLSTRNGSLIFDATRLRRWKSDAFKIRGYILATPHYYKDGHAGLYAKLGVFIVLFSLLEMTIIEDSDSDGCYTSKNGYNDAIDSTLETLINIKKDMESTTMSRYRSVGGGTIVYEREYDGFSTGLLRSRSEVDRIFEARIDEYWRSVSSHYYDLLYTDNTVTDKILNKLCATPRSEYQAPGLPTLKDYGKDAHTHHSPLQLCEGDCDYDYHCQDGLKCLERDGLSKVPGCYGDGPTNFDYCVNPSKCPGGSDPEFNYIQNIDSNPNCPKLRLCQGNCRQDDNCDSPNVCQVASSHNPEAIGCLADDNDPIIIGWNYCVKPQFKIITQSPTPFCVQNGDLITQITGRCTQYNARKCCSNCCERYGWSPTKVRCVKGPAGGSVVCDE